MLVGMYKLICGLSKVEFHKNSKNIFHFTKTNGHQLFTQKDLMLPWLTNINIIINT